MNNFLKLVLAALLFSVFFVFRFFQFYGKGVDESFLISVLKWDEKKIEFFPNGFSYVGFKGSSDTQFTGELNSKSLNNTDVRWTWKEGSLEKVIVSYEGEACYEYHFKKGTQDGVAKAFKDGKPWVNGTFKNGFLDGEVNVFDPEEGTSIKCFRDGKLIMKLNIIDFFLGK